MSGFSVREQFIDHSPATEDFKREVLQGLSRSQKLIPPKFFYDRPGSELFEQICSSKEYYVTRTENGILEAHAPEMGSKLGTDCLLFEFGSGASFKTRYLLSNLNRPAGYVPIDISRSFLLDSAEELRKAFPKLNVIPVCADFTMPVVFPMSLVPAAKSRAVFFPGSTIGNFEPIAALGLLRNTARLLGSSGRLLIGVDRVKDRSILEAAYNDSSGVTAQFNLNLLTRMNRELGSNFNLSRFKHAAFYNAKLERVEMHIVSTCDQIVTIQEQSFHFGAKETIHSECSYKYRPEKFERLARGAGFKSLQRWDDPEELFSVFLLQVDTLRD